MVRTRISARGQIVLPKEIRERLHLEEGQELAVEVVSGAVVLRPLGPIPRRHLVDWRGIQGCLEGTNALEDLLTEHQSEVKRGR